MQIIEVHEIVQELTSGYIFEKLYMWFYLKYVRKVRSVHIHSQAPGFIPYFSGVRVAHF
jgi:hypothetical protein